MAKKLIWESHHPLNECLAEVGVVIRENGVTIGSHKYVVNEEVWEFFKKINKRWKGHISTIEILKSNSISDSFKQKGN
jgi:hypothetical protein